MAEMQVVENSIEKKEDLTNSILEEKTAILYDVPTEGKTWTYRPKESSHELQYEAQRLDCIKDIANLLKNIELPMPKDDEMDYPILDASALQMVGIDYHCGREVFVVGEYAFFRRCNDDWCGRVMFSYSVFDGKVCWTAPCSLNVLRGLEGHIITKGAESVTKEDVAALFQ